MDLGCSDWRSERESPRNPLPLVPEGLVGRFLALQAQLPGSAQAGSAAFPRRRALHGTEPSWPSCKC